MWPSLFCKVLLHCNKIVIKHMLLFDVTSGGTDKIHTSSSAGYKPEHFQFPTTCHMPNQQAAKWFSIYERKIKQRKLHLHLVTKDICMVFVFKQLFGDSSEQSEMFMSVVCIVTHSHSVILFQFGIAQIKRSGQKQAKYRNRSTMNWISSQRMCQSVDIPVFESLNLEEGRDPGGQPRICVPTLRKVPPDWGQLISLCALWKMWMNESR